MDKEVKNILESVVKDLLTLEVTLFFNSHPEKARDLQDICRHLGSEPENIKPALDHLLSTGIIERFPLGANRYEIYSYTHNEDLRRSIERLSQCYHDDPKSRIEIIRHIISHAPHHTWRQHDTRNG